MATTTSRPLSASRLPRTRESRPLILGLAILLIVGGALGSAYLAIQSGHRAYFVSVGTEVPQGVAITRDDLTRVSLPEDYKNGISTDDIGKVVGKTATTRLLVGTVVIPGMLTTKPAAKAGQAVVYFAVSRKQLGDDAHPGDLLALTLTNDDDSRGNDNKAILATLLSVDRSKSSGSFGAGGDDDITVGAAIDLSCATWVGRARQSNDVVPALITGSKPDSSSVETTCGS